MLLVAEEIIYVWFIVITSILCLLIVGKIRWEESLNMISLSLKSLDEIQMFAMLKLTCFTILNCFKCLF